MLQFLIPMENTRGPFYLYNVIGTSRKFNSRSYHFQLLLGDPSIKYVKCSDDYGDIVGGWVEDIEAAGGGFGGGGGGCILRSWQT